MVDIVIPIYKKTPTSDDLISLQQAEKVFKNYEVTIIHPEGLDISAYKKYENFNFKAFDKQYFENILGYNRLMLNVDFYKSFHKKYILIYQTDAYIFKDELMFWCEKNYDYIGAPWLRSHEKLPFMKYLWDFLGFSVKAFINYKGNGKVQKNKSLLYNEVGNGGFSLRKREKMIEVLQKLSTQVEIYTSEKNHNAFYAEDVFFSIEPLRNNIAFSKPNYKQACGFAIENKPEKAFAYNNNTLPLGCHRWDKEHRNFWKKYIGL